jgi:thioredoxin-related protein
MKKITALTTCLIVAICGLTAFNWNKPVPSPVAEENSLIHWYTIEEAQKLCEKEPRKIFMDVYASWCGWCKVMDNKTFSNPTIAKYMSANYYCVKFDAESKDTIVFNGQKFWNESRYHSFATQALQGNLAFPSFIFIDKTRTKFTMMQGYYPADKFEPYIHYYLNDAEPTVSFEKYKETFKSELKPADTKDEAAPNPGH